MAQKIAIFIAVLAAILLAPNVKAATIAPSFSSFVKTIDTRMSKNFQKNNGQVAYPSYGTPEWGGLGAGREGILAAVTYRWRAAAGDRAASQYIASMFDLTLTQLESPGNHQGFNDAQTLINMVALAKTLPRDLNGTQRGRLWTGMRRLLDMALESPDTENRYIIVAARWANLLPELQRRQLISPTESGAAAKIFRQQLDRQIASSISPDGWYREGKNFTIHYHIVAAYNLLLYARWTHQTKYETLAKKMYANVKKMAFQNGMLESLIGHRPPGSGAQTYAMMGVMGRAFNDADADVFFTYASGNRFFSDPRYPDRLEYHQTVQKKVPWYHDDIAFPDIGESALLMPGWKASQPIVKRTILRHPSGTYQDRDFRIVNTGKKLVITDRVRKKTITVALLPDGGHTTLTQRPLK